MWYENIGFKVDRKLKSAISCDDLEAVKKLLMPSKDLEKISLNSLLPETIKLGKIIFNHKDSLLKFYHLSDDEKKEGEVVFNDYLAESIDILVDLIGYLVSKGADVNAVMDPVEHQIWCSDRKPLGAGNFANEKEHYNILASLYMPLAVGKVNAGVIGEISLACKYRMRGDHTGNYIKSAQRNLMRYIKEQNDNMQIKLTQKLLDKGADLNTTRISKKGHEINFLDFINDCADYSYTKQKNTFLTFYKLQKSKTLKQILETLKFIDVEAFPMRYSICSIKPCSALEDLIQKETDKMYLEIGKKFALSISGSSDNPIGQVTGFLNLKELTAVVTAIEEKQAKVLVNCMGQEALEL